MNKTSFFVPDNFLWGGALSANQSEGAYDEDGKAMTIADVFYFDMNKSYKNVAPPTLDKKLIEKAKQDKDLLCYPKRRGIDFYHTYKEDIALLAGMGFKTFRYSICWSRVFPDVNQLEPNSKGLDFYDRIVDECLKYGMEPVITILHTDLPIQIIEEYKGWSDRRVVELYLHFCKTLFVHFKGRVKYWIPFNELNMDLLNPSRKMGILKEDHENYEEAVYQALHYEFVASASAAQLAHTIDPNNKVGVMIAYLATYPSTCKPEDVLSAQQKDKEDNLFFYDVLLRGVYPYYMKKKFEENGWTLDISGKDLDMLRDNTADFAGLSYYNSRIQACEQSQLEKTAGNEASVFKNPYLQTNEWGWIIDPIGLRYTLNHVYELYQKPIFILENGSGFIETPDDSGQLDDPYRIEYYKSHIEQMKFAMEDGVEIWGYIVWSPIDTVAASTGQMKKRYGFIYVDQDDTGAGTHRRIKKSSYQWYKNVILTNGKEL